jgi:hypothetical protein
MPTAHIAAREADVPAPPAILASSYGSSMRIPLSGIQPPGYTRYIPGGYFDTQAL